MAGWIYIATNNLCILIVKNNILSFKKTTVDDLCFITANTVEMGAAMAKNKTTLVRRFA